MSVAKYEIVLDWKEFNLSLDAVHSWMQAHAGSEYCGMSADSKLHIWFANEPDQDAKDAVSAHWESLDEESDEAAAYKSAADQATEKAAKKASGKAKLLALGLTEDEIAAMVG